jgi:hypothetical protein
MHKAWELELPTTTVHCVDPNLLADYLLTDGCNTDTIVVDELYPEQYTDTFFTTLRNSGREVFMITPQAPPSNFIANAQIEYLSRLKM